MTQKESNLFVTSGILFTVLVGTLLHFTYNFLDKNTLVAFFTPTSESVWEHLKLGFYSLLLFGILVYPKIRNKVHNYIFAVGLSSLILNITIVLIFYTYTSFTNSSILIIDIATYISACIIASVLFSKLITLPQLPPYFRTVGLFIIVTSVLSFAFFTLYPPNLPIFLTPL